MAECGVCFEVFENEGTHCPKILPCIHTLCLNCLQRLETNSQIECPFDRLLHPVPEGGVKQFPTNQQVLRQNSSKKNKISPISGEPRRDSKIGICETHGKPLIIYNAADGRYCETCLHLDAFFISERESRSADLTGQGSQLQNNAHAGNSARGGENDIRICVLHGKPLIIYNDIDGRQCETCLNMDSSIIDESRSGEQTRPASSDQQSQPLRSSACARNSTTGGENEGARCPLHQKPLIRITYNIIDGTVQELCETCLNPDSSIMPQRESRSAAQISPATSHQQSQSLRSSARARNSAGSGQNEAGICTLHRKPLIINDEIDGRLCETCLNLDSSISSESESVSGESQHLQNSTGARNSTTVNEGMICSAHGRPLLGITCNLMDRTEKRFCQTCLNMGSSIMAELGQQSNYQRPSAYARDSSTGRENEIEICTLHGKPVIGITRYLTDNTEQRFCETCLNLDYKVSKLEYIDALRERYLTSGRSNSASSRRGALGINPFVLYTAQESSYQQSQLSQPSASFGPEICQIHKVLLTQPPFCDLDEAFCEACLDLDSDTISVPEIEEHGLLSSRQSVRFSNRDGICEQHGQPFTEFTYDVGHGKQRRFCQTCLNSGSRIAH